jgi:transposase
VRGDYWRDARSDSARSASTSASRLASARDGLLGGINAGLVGLQGGGRGLGLAARLGLDARRLGLLALVGLAGDPRLLLLLALPGTGHGRGGLLGRCAALPPHVVQALLAALLGSSGALLALLGLRLGLLAHAERGRPGRLADLGGLHCGAGAPARDEPDEVLVGAVLAHMGLRNDKNPTVGRDEPDDHGIGRSRGGLSTKSHALVDGLGRLLALIVGPGQAGDCPVLPLLLGEVRVARRGPGRPRTTPDSLSGDKAYSSRANRELLRARGITAVIPERADQIANTTAGRDDPSDRRAKSRTASWPATGCAWLPRCRPPRAASSTSYVVVTGSVQTASVD